MGSISVFNNMLEVLFELGAFVRLKEVPKEQGTIYVKSNRKFYKIIY